MGGFALQPSRSMPTSCANGRDFDFGRGRRRRARAGDGLGHLAIAPGPQRPGTPGVRLAGCHAARRRPADGSRRPCPEARTTRRGTACPSPPPQEAVRVLLRTKFHCQLWGDVQTIHRKVTWPPLTRTCLLAASSVYCWVCRAPGARATGWPRTSRVQAPRPSPPPPARPRPPGQPIGGGHWTSAPERLRDRAGRCAGRRVLARCGHVGRRDRASRWEHHVAAAARRQGGRTQTGRAPRTDSKGSPRSSSPMPTSRSSSVRSTAAMCSSWGTSPVRAVFALGTMTVLHLISLAGGLTIRQGQGDDDHPDGGRKTDSFNFNYNDVRRAGIWNRTSC